MAACDVRPPRSVTMPAAVFMIGSQSGIRDLGDEDLAGAELVRLTRIVKHADAPVDDAVADGETLDDRGRAPFHRVEVQLRVRALRLCTVSGRAWTTKSSPLTPSLAHSMSIGTSAPRRFE